MSLPYARSYATFQLETRYTRNILSTACVTALAAKSPLQRRGLDVDSHDNSSAFPSHANNSSSRKESFAKLHTSRTRVCFADTFGSVVDNVIRRKDQCNRSSATYDPGRHACRSRHVWLDPHIHSSSESEHGDTRTHLGSCSRQ